MKTGYYKQNGEFLRCTILGETDIWYLGGVTDLKPSGYYKHYLIQFDNSKEKYEVPAEDVYVTKD